MQSTSAVTNLIVKWAQRKDKVFLTIDAVEITNPEIDIVDGKVLKFSGSDKKNKYSFEIEFFDEVVKEDSKFSLGARNIFLNIKKKTKGPYWPRLTKESKKLNWLQVDWTHYIDEDDEDEENKGPSFANEQNFPGFGNYGGDDEMNDEDDIPDMKEEHVHGENCNHDEKKSSLDDLDEEANK